MSRLTWVRDTLIAAKHSEADADRVVAEIRAEARAEQAAEIERLRKERDQLDRTLDEVMAERDSAQDALDRMALAVAPEEVIGEHSSGNNPWANAFELITPAAEVDGLKKRISRMSSLFTYSGSKPYHRGWNDAVARVRSTANETEGGAS